MDAIIPYTIAIGLTIAGSFMRFGLAPSDLKKMNTSISNLRELKKECELHLPRTQQCKITFTGDL